MENDHYLDQAQANAREKMTVSTQILVLSLDIRPKEMKQ